MTANELAQWSAHANEVMDAMNEDKEITGETADKIFDRLLTDLERIRDNA